MSDMNLPHTLEDDFQHFLCYSANMKDPDARLRLAYEHGSERGAQSTGAAAPQDERALFERSIDLDAQAAGSEVTFSRHDDGTYRAAAIQSAWHGWQARAALPAQAVAPAAVSLDRYALAALIASHLVGTYHCTRVWEAWQVGTMSQDDFEDVNVSDTPMELADAILALAAPVQDVAPTFPAGPSNAQLDEAVRYAFASTNATPALSMYQYWYRKGYANGWGAASAVAKDVAPSDASEWSSYVAECITTYLQSDRAARETAITGIIERRLKFLPSAAQPAALPADAQQEYTPVAFVTREEKYDVRGACLCKEGLELPAGTGLYAKTSELGAANAAARTQEGAAS